MVKIQNVFGDIKKGKQDNAIYQLHYGRQIRRVGYKEKIQPSLRQINQRMRFKDAVSWVNSLTSTEKANLKKYYSKSYPSWKPGQPSTWYNWAKTFVMTRPSFSIIDEDSGRYVIKHPCILKIEEFNIYGRPLFIHDNLSNILENKYCSEYSRVPHEKCGLIQVTIINGDTFKYSLTEFIPPVSSGCLTLACFDLETPCTPPTSISPYHYYDEYTITGSTSGSLTDYPFVPLPFYYHRNKVKPNFDDVRWYLDDGVTPLDYHVRHKINGYLATYCVKIPYIPQFPNTVKIRAYYGDPTANNGENPANVYRFFDDFNGDALDTTNWTQRSGTVTVSNSILRLNKGVIQHNTSFSTPLAFDYKVMDVQYRSGDRRIGMNINTYDTDPTYASYWWYRGQWMSCCNRWFNREFKSPIVVSLAEGTDGKMALYLDDVLAQQNDRDALPNPSKPGLQAGTFAQQWMDVDWFAVRDVDRNPPTLTNIQTLGEI